MNKKELFKKDFARIRRKIEKYNNDLSEYIKMTGDNEVPEIDSTVIGYSTMEPIKVEEIKNGIAYTEDGFRNEVTVESECGECWLSGEDILDDILTYNRRRLRKGKRVWKSENPDAELEKDE